MAFTVANVTARVRQICAGFYPDSDPYALTFVNEVMVDIALEAGLFSYEGVDITLVANQRDYALDNVTYQISSAIYYTDAGTAGYYNLKETSWDEMESRYAGWQAFPAAQPFKYMTNGNSISLYPTPNTDTALSGFPKVTLWVRKAHQFAALSDTLPVQTPRMDAWAYPIAAKWCLEHDQSRLPVLLPIAAQSIKDLKAFSYGRLMRLNPSIKPQFNIPWNR